MLKIKTLSKTRTKGFTLTEAAIVLGILGLVLGAIWAAAGSVYNNNRVQTTLTQVLTIVNSIRSSYGTYSAIPSDLTAVLAAKAGMVPRDMLDDHSAPTKVTGVWGGDVTIAAANVGGTAGDSFKITFAKVPRSACMDILARTTGVGRDSGLFSAGGGNTLITTFPIGASTAEAQCASSSNNTLTFNFLLKG